MLSVQTSFYVIIPIIFAVFLAVVLIGKMPAKKGRIVLLMMLAGYMAVYSYLVFFYRSPAAYARIRLMPFWSYREAFSFEKGIVRLGVAREILMNILVYIPLGMIMACLMKETAHPIMYPLLVGIGLSIATEVIQYFTHTGLMETDDLMNNTLGMIIGITMFRSWNRHRQGRCNSLKE